MIKIGVVLVFNIAVQPPHESHFYVPWSSHIGIHRIIVVCFPKRGGYSYPQLGILAICIDCYFIHFSPQICGITIREFFAKVPWLHQGRTFSKHANKSFPPPPPNDSEAWRVGPGLGGRVGKASRGSFFYLWWNCWQLFLYFVMRVQNYHVCISSL